MEQALGKREIIAEDLGYMSETVRQLVQDSGFPGMKVLEFAFDSRDTGSASDYLPHNYPVNSVAYTGTHDNETLVSWYQTITSAERTTARSSGSDEPTRYCNISHADRTCQSGMQRSSRKDQTGGFGYGEIRLAVPENRKTVAASQKKTNTGTVMYQIDTETEL